MKRSTDPVSADAVSPEKKARGDEPEPADDGHADTIGALFVEDAEGSLPVQSEASPATEESPSQARPASAVSSQPSSPEQEPLDFHEPAPVCHFFAKGMCRNGTSCPFRHDPKRIVCTYFLHGNCRNGTSCRFSHELPGAKDSVAEEAPDGPPPDVCKFFWHGNCRAGSSCRWRHVKAPSALSAAPRPNLPAKSDPSVSERAKALLQRHSISRIAHESGASEVVVKARGAASKPVQR